MQHQNKKHNHAHQNVAICNVLAAFSGSLSMTHLLELLNAVWAAAVG
jgi:hypothetical protein